MPFTAADCQRARLQVPALDRRQAGVPIAYLDGPAGSQMPAPVIDAISGYYRESNANTHGQFATSKRSDELLQEVREKAAALLGAADWRSVSFGANMTTLNFALAHAIGRACAPGDEIVVTQLDHEANRGPWLMLAERGLVIREVALLPDGTLDPASLAVVVNPRTRLVAMGLASNALGTVNDVTRARELTRAVGAWLLLDAVHYAPHFAIDVAEMDPDFLLCSAYKFYGPHVGLLYSRPGLLETLATDRLRVQDPAAPFRIETGTLNHAALVGVGAAIDYLASWGRGATLRARLLDAMAGIGEWEGALARRYWSEVRAIPGVTVHGPAFAADGEGRRAPTVSLTLAGVPAATVARRLGERGIQVWDGDFYAVRAVEILGLAGLGGLLRTGFLLYNTVEEVDRLLAGLREIATGGA